MPRRTSSLHIPTSLLLIGLGFQGLSGLFGGGALIASPSGRLLHLPLNLLQGSPFSDYLVPGLILFTILGIGPLVVAFAVWKQRLWGWYGTIATGGALLIWIGVEIWMVGYHTDPPLQLIYGSLGAVLLGLAFHPSVRTAYQPNGPSGESV